MTACFQLQPRPQDDALAPKYAPLARRSKIGWTKVAIAALSSVISVGLMDAATAATPASLADSPAAQKLNKMFSPKIQQVLNSCAQQGSVNLSAGADKDGSVICANGTRNSPVQFNEYVSTVSDFLSASFLVGVRAALQSYPGAQMDMVTSYLATPDGKASLQDALTNAITTSGLVPQSSQKSVSFLVNRVMQRSLPILQNTNKFSNLLGSTEQYRKVANNFCKPPGMTVEKARTLVPQLDAVQIYAICVQESGLSDEVQKEIQQPNK
ncbi:hypothetical protein NDA01_14095 [Trichocoleus desertorum AS-A10]|uniref:hypothetical protein n=1 Tax=Trichocoleus desertorum TaxID=1481672 RepID=UPI003296C50B